MAVASMDSKVTRVRSEHDVGSEYGVVVVGGGGGLLLFCSLFRYDRGVDRRVGVSDGTGGCS